MADYLSPSIGKVIPQLEQACDDLTRQALIRELTNYTKKLCESDPELADILLEGTKSLPRCIRYILEQAQQVAVKNVEAMLEDEFHALDDVKVRGQMATMAGAAIGSDQVFQWAKDYYYGGAEIEPTGKKKPDPKKPGGKTDKKVSAKNGAAKSPADPSVKGSGSAATATGSVSPGPVAEKKVPAGMNEGTQLTLDGFKAASSAAA